jgi:hypothetical protein
MPLLKMDGFDDCIAGVINDSWGRMFIVYDRQKVIEKLMADGMNEEEAIEFHDFNQAGAWVGDNTPAFLDKYDPLAE